MSRLSLGAMAQLACLWEAGARKLGNVHPGQSFADLSYADFVASAVAIGRAFDKARDQTVGKTILEAIQATRAVVSTNTNLGIVLLLAPLAAVSPGDSLRAGVKHVLDSLTVADSRDVYEAIRLAQPGGLGKVSKEDIRGEPTQSLRAVMALAADRDLVARQYANEFAEVFVCLRHLEERLNSLKSIEQAIVATHLTALSMWPDSLIARKCGSATSEEVRLRASAVLAHYPPTSDKGRQALADFDVWLTADGQRRNPGATADLVTACLFAALREDIMKIPLRIPW